MRKMKPVYLLAGGRSANRKATDLLIREAFRETGKDSPSVGYVGAASGDDKDFFHRYADIFRENGTREVKHALLVPDNADISRARASLEESDMVCLSGGDVAAGIQILKDRGMINFLAGLYRGGKPFLGLSAGSIMLARKWVRWQNPEDNQTAEVFLCLGLAPVLCDTHDEEGGWEELKALLMLEKEGLIGYGISTGAALKVLPVGSVEALGGAIQRYVRHGGQVKRLSDMTPP